MLSQVYTDSIITDTLNWILLEWNYIADSAYRYVYIGNFFDDYHTDTTVINAPIGQFGIAYYFIDSINIFCSDTKCLSSVDEQQISDPPMVFNAATKKMQFYLDAGASIQVYDAIGRVVYVMGHLEGEVSFSNFLSGTYIAQLKTSNKIFNQRFTIY